MTITEKRADSQTEGTQWSPWGGGGAVLGEHVKSTNCCISDKPSGYSMQHKEYSQYYMRAINEVWPLKAVNHYHTLKTYIIFYTSYTSITLEEEMATHSRILA